MTDQLRLDLPPPLDWRALRVVLGSRHLNTTEKLVIMRVWSFDGVKRGRHRGCYASIAYLADELGLSEGTIKRVLGELVFLGIMHSQPHGRGRLRVITMPAEAHPRSDEPDDMVRARHTFDAIVLCRRNDLEDYRRSRKKRQVSAPIPEGYQLRYPYRRDSLGTELPTPLPRGTAQKREPVSLGDLLHLLDKAAE